MHSRVAVGGLSLLLFIGVSAVARLLSSDLSVYVVIAISAAATSFAGRPAGAAEAGPALSTRAPWRRGRHTGAVSVSRETVAAVVGRFPVEEPATATEAISRLLEALVAEPDPPTTVREPRQALDVHVADSLAALVIPAVRDASRIADIGAGAGFPGLALAAALPHAQIDLVEATGRKCEVIDRLAVAAGLDPRARAVPARAEEWAAAEGGGAYDLVTARALAPLAVICEYAAPLLRVGGGLVAWKGGREPAEEDAGTRAAVELGLSSPEVAATTPYRSSRNRHLHVYLKVTETPDRYPRRPGVAVRKPIA
jgi:16S rRNA (guanine527-N7)-methyltransferase